ncbi:cysteine proteinase [Testicularia cyperi]|uniref:Ubiquitin carboxyl-terminal hydrolase n=1 Tax=Testicularia cyperi TaxID=1882483 RepID=A0A317XY95_9BASI|nr:cysteine proteinase [Testicularia cyperi]
MAEVARRLPSQSESNSRSYSQSPQKKHNRSKSHSQSHQSPRPLFEHRRSSSSSGGATLQNGATSGASSSASLPSSPSKADRKKLAKEILANGGTADQLSDTLKQRGMLHALLSDPVRFVKSNDKQGQDYTTMGITPVNDPNYAAAQKRKTEQKQHSLLLHTDSPKINGTSAADTESVPSSPTKSSPSKGKGVARDLYPFKVSLRFPGKVRPAATGLSNYGNTCYMNSVMQSLVHTPSLAFALLTQDLDALHGEWGGKPNANFDAVAAMHNFAKRSLQGSRPTNAPQEFNRNLKAFAKPLRQGRQEDAHEYLRFLLEAMQQSCLARAPKALKPDDPVRRTTFVQKIFGGKLRSRVTCHSCGYNSDTFDPFMDLSLDVRKGINTLADAFRAFVAKDKLTGSEKYKCDKCKRKVDATKQFTIETAPPALTIHLKRFTAFGGKVSRQIAFDESINVAAYLSVNRGPARYKLYAVVHHYGSGPNSGHYVASVKSPSGRWTRMDDSHVSEMGRSGPTNDQSAYILFYLREKDEALQQAISGASVSGFVQPQTAALNGKKRKEAPRSDVESSDNEDVPSDTEQERRRMKAKAAKLLAARSAGSSVQGSPKARSVESTLNRRSSAQTNGRAASDNDSNDDSSETEDGTTEAGASVNGSLAHQKERALLNGTSANLDRLLSSKPKSVASFYGSSGAGTSNPFSMPAEDSDELGTAVDREEYESLIGGRPPSKPSAKVTRDPEVESDDDDDDDEDAEPPRRRQSSGPPSPLSKKEKRKQKKAVQAIQLAKANRGVPTSPYANPFAVLGGAASAKDQKKLKAKKNKALPSGMAGRMKPRPN